MTPLRLVLVPLLLAGAHQAGNVTPQAKACAPAGGVAFGSATRTPVSIEGRIYFLQDDARTLHAGTRSIFLESRSTRTSLTFMRSASR